MSCSFRLVYRFKASKTQILKRVINEKLELLNSFQKSMFDQ